MVADYRPTAAPVCRTSGIIRESHGTQNRRTYRFFRRLFLRLFRLHRLP